MSVSVVSTDLLKDLFSAQRAPGHHVSGSINRMLSAIDARYRRRTEDSLPHNYFALGHAVEAALADALNQKYPDRFQRVGELTLDGITGTPDLLDMDPHHKCPRCNDKCFGVVDVKLTKQTASKLKDPDGEWMWKYWVQIKAYAHMLGLHRGAVLLVFINGDYKGGIEPVVSMVTDNWSQADLAENWQMTVRNQGDPE